MNDSTNYLNDLPEWSADIAYKLGHEHGFELTPEHIEILDVARIFYAEYGFSPSMRPLCKVVSASLGTDKGRSIYLNQLFPGSPAKLAAKLAGLPKPKNCL